MSDGTERVFVIQKPDKTLVALPIRDLARAQELSKHPTMVWQGIEVEVRGVMSEKDFEGLQTFWQIPAFDRPKQNAEYYKKYGKWPK